MGVTDSRDVALARVYLKRLFGEDNFGAVRQLLEAAGRDLIFGIDPFDRRHSRISRSRLDVALVGCAVLNHVDKGYFSVMLDRVCRDQRHIVLRSHQQPRVDELVWKQYVLLVIKEGAKLYGTGRGIDLVVERRQFPGRDFRLLVAVVGIDRQFGAAAQLRQNLVKMILRQREDDRSGLNLRNHRERSAAARLNQVTRIDEAQADASSDRRSDVAVAKLHLVEIEGALIRLDEALILQNDLLLIVELLFG